MKKTAVSSSWVVSVSHEEVTLTMEVEMANGEIYQYFDVPESVYQALITATSVGTYLNQNIKNSYRYTRT